MRYTVLTATVVAALAKATVRRESRKRCGLAAKPAVTHPPLSEPLSRWISTCRWSAKSRPCTCSGGFSAVCVPAAGDGKLELKCLPAGSSDGKGKIASRVAGRRQAQANRQTSAGLALLSRKFDYTTADPPKLRPGVVCTPARAGAQRARPISVSFCSRPFPVVALFRPSASTRLTYPDDHTRSLPSLCRPHVHYNPVTLYAVLSSSRKLALQPETLSTNNFILNDHHQHAGHQQNRRRGRPGVRRPGSFHSPST
jgi:hypothetical protein